jgi:hypothetical protein
MRNWVSIFEIVGDDGLATTCGGGGGVATTCGGGGGLATTCGGVHGTLAVDVVVRRTGCRLRW